MRDLGINEYKVEVFDPATGDTHIMLYRMPNNEEIVSYQVALQSGAGLRPGSRGVDRKKFAKKLHEINLKYGAKILLGFEKGTLALQGKLISSKEGDPDYYPEWKQLLVEKAPQIVQAVAGAAFGGGSVGYGESEDEEGV